MILDEDDPVSINVKGNKDLLQNSFTFCATKTHVRHERL